MENIVYMSTATKLYTDAELRQILVKSQVNNALNHITGLLLYSGGTFVQVLEGEKREVEITYNKILADPRHINIFELTRADIKERSFPNWSMGFKTLSPAEFMPFESFIGSSRSHSLMYATHPALTILKTFTKVSF